jgi:hypothetical protein
MPKILPHRVWLDRNLGAKQVATSIDDSDAYGDYYQFGKAECPTGFRVPTTMELAGETLEIIPGNPITNTADPSKCA